jgi:mannose-6-phosphate isomerase-like protein (cupin superfamily)
MATDTPAPRFDPHGFSNQPYVKRVTKPWGYELHWVAPDAPYMGKVLHIIEGARLSLQIHDEKQESWLLIRGSAAVIWENAAGELIQFRTSYRVFNEVRAASPACWNYGL